MHATATPFHTCFACERITGYRLRVWSNRLWNTMMVEGGPEYRQDCSVAGLYEGSNLLTVQWTDQKTSSQCLLCQRQLWEDPSTRWWVDPALNSSSLCHSMTVNITKQLWGITASFGTCHALIKNDKSRIKKVKWNMIYYVHWIL